MLFNTEHVPLKQAEIANQLIRYWNDLPGVQRKIRIVSSGHQNTKVYAITAKKLVSLMQGNFGRKYHITPKQIQRDRLKTAVLKKHTENIIKQTMNDLVLLYDPEHLPKDKSMVPKDLHRLIYNERTGFSWFFSVSKRIPITIKEKIKQLDSLERYTTLEVFSPIVGDWEETKKNIDKMTELLSVYIELERFWSRQNDPYKKWFYHYQTATAFVREWVMFLVESLDMQIKNVKKLKPYESPMFDRFIFHISGNHWNHEWKPK